MFKINIYLRFALMALLIIGGIVLSVLYGFWYGFPFWLVGLFLLVGYVFLGTVQSAAELMQHNRFAEAEKRLNLTLNPKWLYTANRAYFYIVKATLAVNNKQQDEAEEYLKMAEQMDLPTEDEAAMVQLQLANIQANRQKWQAAQKHFRNAKKYKVTNPDIKEQLSMLEKALKNRGQLRHLRESGGQGNPMSRSSKRRRPKMR